MKKIILSLIIIAFLSSCSLFQKNVEEQTSILPTNQKKEDNSLASNNSVSGAEGQEVGILETETNTGGINNIVWWTYDEYKEWLDEQKKILPNFIGEIGGYYDEKSVLHKEVWTQEKVDEAIQGYERELEYIKNGELVSKPTVEVYDENDLRAMGINVADSTISVEISTGISMNIGGASQSYIYGGSITFGNSETKDLGSYATKEEAFVAVKAFCDEQVKAGKMTQQEADEMLSEFK